MSKLIFSVLLSLIINSAHGKVVEEIKCEESNSGLKATGSISDTSDHSKYLLEIKVGKKAPEKFIASTVSSYDTETHEELLGFLNSGKDGHYIFFESRHHANSTTRRELALSLKRVFGDGDIHSFTCQL
jgi:hypothetical protein